MRRAGIPLLFLLFLPALAEAGEETIRVASVEVRSGPSMTYYPTQELHQGDRVVVYKEEHDFLVIQPPRGEGSLILAKDVTRSRDTARVKAWTTEVLVWSKYGGQMNRIAARLIRGAQVTVLDELELADARGTKRTYYLIQPTPQEFRYLPKWAIVAGGPQGSAPPAGPPVPPTSAAPPSHLPPDLQAELAKADAAYQRARYSGDWAEAEQRYRDLAGSLHHEIRMAALNRLEFVRRAKLLPPETPPSRSRPSRPVPVLVGDGWNQAGSVQYARLPVPVPAQAPGSAAGQTLTNVAVPAAAPAAAARSNETPLRTTSNPPTSADRLPPQRLEPAPTPVVSAQATPQPGPLRGFLRKSQMTHLQLPLYYLADHQGHLRTYVTAGRGVNLEPFVDKPVQLQGGEPKVDASLGKPHMVAAKVERLSP